MTVALRLLDDVRWRGKVVAGERPQALLAALAASGGRPVRAEELIELIWGEAESRNGVKNLQVLVSRTRSACGPDVVVRDGIGYRLGVAPAEVDSVQLAGLVHEARGAIEHDAPRAVELATEALTLADGLATVSDEDAGPLRDLRDAAAADVSSARVILAQSLSRSGAHAEALPALEGAHAERRDDESVLADLLRSEAVVRGPAAALERYERYRRDLRDRLGSNPGELLRRVHRDLLALDEPVRSGVRYDATTLVGRDADLKRLIALVNSSRVVSIVGAGGLGKTRLAHVLARDATFPAVHFVELVGVSAPEDVVAEVGSALGVRDSITSRRTLTPEQRADLRARIAQRLGQSPSLLVLDNCEHVVEAVAELVAFLVSTTADLRILTTSRAPLAIAAERVYALGELGAADAAQLFGERAIAARADVHLAEPVVTRIVERLDGLPLAIELAAAKVRAMALEEIDRRLEDRFTLLRGGDRSAPDRHQTLLAVIDWSWNLLDAEQQRALRRLSLFNDGFTLAAADTVLASSALDSIQGLVDQSLLSVRETADGVRYRMLETVREFGRMQLAVAGEDAEARVAQRRWAVAYAIRYGAQLASPEQVAAIDALSAEEVNLADELRRATAAGERGPLVRLLTALGTFWAIRGEHARLVLLAEAVADAVVGWEPPAELENATRAAMAIMLSNVMIAGEERIGPLRDLLLRLGPGDDEDAHIAGLVRVMLAYDPADAEAFRTRLERLASAPERETALTARNWLCHVRENAGDPAGAIVAAEGALTLVSERDGAWSSAILRTQLAQLTMHLGDTDAATEHARAALPVMERLGATDDEIQLRSLLVLCRIADGRLADAEAELDRIDAIELLNDSDSVLGGLAVQQIGRAELALARGEHHAGLRIYRDSAAHLRTLEFPGIARTGLEPWALFGESTALAAHAYHADASDEAHGAALLRSCRERATQAFKSTDPHLDFPVTGMVLFALGTWALLRDAAPGDDALRLLALADRFAYNRAIPTMSWERATAQAEAALPGHLAALVDEYRDRRPPDILEEAGRAVAQLTA